MANIYKKYTTTVDPVTGKKTKTASPKWWGRYRDAIGVERRISLATDKKVSQLKLNEIVEKVKQEKLGMIDPTEAEMKKPIQTHLDDYEQHLKTKNNEPRYIQEVIGKIKRCIEYNQWKRISQIKVTEVENFLLYLREEEGLSIQTSNHYLKSLKAFGNWLVKNQRNKTNVINGIATLNVQTDRRHDRRPMSMDEFLRILHVAETGPPAVGLTGLDRAMLYLLAAWTGFRRGELGSLTLRNFVGLDTETPFITLNATYSKRRRNDDQVLHPDVAERFKAWLAIRQPGPNEVLFPISEKVGGVDRRTSEMMAFDLNFARQVWLSEAKDDAERQTRLVSDFLRYQDSSGKFADFHSLRHTFITNLCRANVSPKVAQQLARHSDIRLTLNVYSHAAHDERAAGINALPGLPSKK
ncbi:hypothetical protein AGMMS50229_18940 [Campylobacterota bacterium]|nr:hypothetical protein AGMMS50229_18940 [Campylobacterota bacterium]